MKNNTGSGRMFVIIIGTLAIIALAYFISSRGSSTTTKTFSSNTPTNGFIPLNSDSDIQQTNSDPLNPYPYDFSTATPTRVVTVATAPAYHYTYVPTPTVNTPVQAPVVDTYTPPVQDQYVEQQATLSTLQNSFYINSAQYIPPATDVPIDTTQTATTATPLTGGPSDFNWTNGLAGGLAGSVVGMFFGDPMGGAILGGIMGGGGLDKLTGGGGGGAAGGIGGIGGGAGGIGGGSTGGPPIAYGGKVTRVTRCTCGPSSMLDINQASGGTIQLIYTPGATTVYSNFNVNGTGQQVLGQYTAGGQCMVTSASGCTAQGAPKGTLKTIGTS
jgi:hypothetical protein